MNVTDPEYCPHCGKYLKAATWNDPGSTYATIGDGTYTFGGLHLQEPKPSKNEKELNKVNAAYFRRR